MLFWRDALSAGGFHIAGGEIAEPLGAFAFGRNIPEDSETADIAPVGEAERIFVVEGIVVGIFFSSGEVVTSELALAGENWAEAEELLFMKEYPLSLNDKVENLHTFGADIFFDDQQDHCESTRRHVPTGHVPHGVANE